MSESELRGKRALVTGGTRGIGKAIAERIRSMGAEVIITGRKASGAGDACKSFDFSETAEIERAADFVGRGHFDILINNAGITAVGAFSEIPLKEYERVERVNVTAPFRLCQAALPWMIDRGWGRIVNVSSIFGVIARDQRAPYCMSKFALNGMTAALSAEAAQHGVLVNSVCPGFIDTELTHSVLSDEQISKLCELVPAKRLGKPEEVAALIGWLVGPQNTFMSGQEIIIDGGYTRV